MSKKTNYDTIIRPVITEKTLKLIDELNQYVFEVDKRSDKKEVKSSVEEKYKVKVEKVRIVNIRGKRVTWGNKRIPGSKKDLKKAVVTLSSKDKIDEFKVE